MNEYDLQIRQCEIELQNLADELFLKRVPTNKINSVHERIDELIKEIKHFNYLQKYELENEIEKHI
tara:strand:- start:5262 stop:5459 length:198 start_codon:yes stop_codon:yes gene_type:complete